MNGTMTPRWICAAVVLVGCATGADNGFCIVDADCPGRLVCETDTCVSHDGPDLGAAGSGAPADAEPAPASDPAATLGAAATTTDATRDPALAPSVDPAADPSPSATNDGSGTTPMGEQPFSNPPGQSRCEQTDTTIRCERNEDTFMNRLVVWQVPLGDAPAEGWPAVIVFQGSLYGPDLTWEGDTSLPFGAIHQIRMQAALLDHGFAVMAPAADGVAWATNFPGYEASTDATFIPALLDAIEIGRFGPVDVDRLYATGMSSGGYMTSRMAVSYPGRFRALAIQSGSYATCSNVLCAIPALPTDHPPTLFLHGELDVAVPIATMRMYADALDTMGIETRIVVDPQIVHQWLKVAPEEITTWFLTH